MVVVIFLCFLQNVILYCECQLPINGRFTDEFGSNVDDPFRILTGETTRRILNQFQSQKPVQGQTISRLNRMGSDLVPAEKQTLFSFIQSELGRMGMDNTNFISKSQSGVITGNNLGNFRSTDLFQGRMNKITPMWGNTNNVRTNAEVNTKAEIPKIQQTNKRNQLKEVKISAGNDLSQEIKPIFSDNGSIRAPPSFSVNNMPNSNGVGLSEADLLQMGTTDLAALGKHITSTNNAIESVLPSNIARHAISMNSIVDLNSQSNQSWRSNSSTEEKLILALLERLIELQENRPQEVSQPIAVHDRRGITSEQIRAIRRNSFTSSGANSFGINGDSTDIIDMHKSQASHLSPLLHRGVDAGSLHQVPLISGPCQYRGCPTGYYCVTIALSDLFADFCPAGSPEACKCAQGCNFQNRFLPENAVERVGRCRKCLCENGEIFCRFTWRCRIRFQQMS